MTRRALRPPTKELRTRLGHNMRELRMRHGISQEEVSFRAETHKGSISALELGKKVPRIDTFIRLAGALETTPSELTAGILWTSTAAIVLPGGFEVPEDPALAAEVAALRRSNPRRRRRAGG